MVDGTSALAAATEVRRKGKEHSVTHVPAFDQVVQVEFTSNGGIQLDEAFYPHNPGIEPPYGTLTPVDEIPVETTETVQSTLPPTTMDLHVVRDLLQEETGVSYDQRIGRLLTYAWNSSTIVERTIPSEFYAYATDNPADWYTEHAGEIKELIEQRTGLIEIYDGTDEYVDRSPFLRNAISIHDTAENRGRRHEGLRVEIGARMILLEAIELSTVSQDD